MKKLLPFISARRFVFVCIVLVFVAVLAIIRGTQQTPDKRLFEAVHHQEYEDVKAALEAGANPNITVHPEPHLLPPEPILAYAMMWSGPIPSALVEKGADVNALAGNNSPVLIKAIEKQDVGLVAMMLSKGANPNCNYRVNPRGYVGSGYKNALITAIELKNLDIVKLLLQKGANPNYKLRSASSETAFLTPLMFALEVSPRAVALLLDAGADPTIRDEQGRTALDCAREAKNTEGAKILTDWQRRKRNDTQESLRATHAKSG